MIAQDSHPFSIVDDDGFRSLLDALQPRYIILSRKYFSESIMLKLFEDMKSVVDTEISAVSHFSLTTDKWTTYLNSSSLLSLTAHWLNNSFEQRSALLLKCC